VYYFAYGSNMSVRRLRQRVASARPLGRALLERHDLRFHKTGRDHSGKCDAFFTDRPRDAIYGVVYRLAPADKLLLDRIEGLGAGYDEKRVRVALANGGELEAVTYVATHLDSRLQPFCWYKTHVLAGARDAALPAAYVNRIRAVDVRRDPNRRRRAREEAVHLRKPR
jgi:cation transport regulator ChaC